jgi:ABC-type multidrug transport system fused ATPase/permease subunit
MLGATRKLHQRMIAKVLLAPINLFFDVTPTGTILNRFSKDLQILDSRIVFTIGNMLVQLF